MNNKPFKQLILSSMMAGTLVTGTNALADPLVAGIEAAFPPWAYAEGGEYKGIAVDAMRAIAENQGLEVEFRDMPWPSLIPALASERIDLLVTGLNVTEERNEVLDFTIPWWENDDEVMVNADSELNVVTALCCGATIGAQGGSTQNNWVQTNLVENEAIDVTLRSYENYVTAMEDMRVGRLDSVIVSTDTAEDFIDKGREVRIAGTITQGQPQALAVSRGDPNEILATLNRGIMELYESGQWQEIVHSYAPYASIRQIPATMPDYVRTYQAPIAGLDD
ncbi:MAG: transporter substrate-binding domain-containing protein [Halomonas sp.]